MISIILPIPPTANKLWAPVRTKRGAKFVSRDGYADWKAMAKREVEAQREGASITGSFRAAVRSDDATRLQAIQNLARALKDLSL